MLNKLTIILFINLFLWFSLTAEDNLLRFHHLTTEDGLPNNSIDCIIQDKYGFIWIATLDGLCRFDGCRLKVYSGNETNAKALINNRPIAMTIDRYGNIWISFSAEHKRVCRYNYETDDFSRFSNNKIDPQIQQKLIRNLNKGIRIVENGHYRWDSNTLSLIQTNKINNTQHIYKSDVKTSWGLLDEFILSLYLDKQNVLWVGTDNGGVSFADVHQPDFSYYPYHDNTANKIKESTIRAIYQAPTGELWVGTRNNGFAKIDRDGNNNIYFKHKENDINSLANNSVRKIYGDRYGLLWIGTKNGLDKFNPRTRKFTHYTQSSKNPIPDNWIFAIEEDSEGTLWIGTWIGLARYDRKNDKFIPYNPAQTLLSPRVRVIMEDRNQNLWVGTEGGGLTCLKKTKKNDVITLTPTHFSNRPENSNSLSENRVYCLCEDKYGMIWIGTGRGLDRLNPANGNFTHFPSNTFLIDKVIHGVLSENESVWVSHLNGMTQIDCKTLKTRDFTKKDDLYNNEFSEDAYFKNTKTGELFFGGNNGFNSFYPTKIQQNSFPPKVVLTDFRISNKSLILNKSTNGRIILKRPLYLSDQIELNWSERNIQIEFAALHFSNPKNNKYAYRLTGFDKDWIITDASNRLANYSNLASGKYLFEVKASNCDGIWTKAPTSLLIIINSAWWSTWWAYLFYILLISGAIFFALKYITDRQKFQHEIHIERLKADKMQEVDEMKTKFFTNISHEFRTPLTLILDPVEKLLLQETKDKKTNDYYHLIQLNAQRLLQLINQYLDLKKVESGNAKLHISSIEIVNYLRNIVNSFELHALDHEILLSFESSIAVQYTSFDIDKLDKIVLNLLSNAFKYTPNAGKITVSLDLNDNKSAIIVKIADSGIGIPKELYEKIFDPFFQVQDNHRNSSSGIGLALVKELVNLHNGSIIINSNLGFGSCFTVTLPIVGVENEHKYHPDSPIVNNNFYIPNSQAEVLDNCLIENEKSKLPMVLVVEDNADVRNYLVNELSDIFHIRYAIDGNDGLAKAFETIPDLVLSDIMMPGINGLELCKKLKSDERTSHIPVVLLTAQQTDEYKISGFETGADAFITKPFSSTILRVRILNLIESRQRLRLLFDKSTGFDTNVIAVNNVDKVFLDKLVNIINGNIENPGFDIEKLSGMMHLGRTQLYRKIKSLTNKTAQEFVSTIRLNKAAEMILSGLYSNTQVAEMIGYSEVGNFSRSFVRQFGMTPKAYKNSFKKV